MTWAEIDEKMSSLKFNEKLRYRFLYWILVAVPAMAGGIGIAELNRLLQVFVKGH